MKEVENNVVKKMGVELVGIASVGLESLWLDVEFPRWSVACLARKPVYHWTRNLILVVIYREIQHQPV